MPANPGIVSIGASLAKAEAAQAMRLDHGYDGSIILIGDEPHLPYRRPALTKHSFRTASHRFRGRVPYPFRRF